jgi:hypothetical protein
VNYAVPCVSGIVDNDVNLAISKLRCLLDQGLDVGIVEDVAADGDGLAAGGLDRVDYSLGFFWYRSVCCDAMR